MLRTVVWGRVVLLLITTEEHCRKPGPGSRPQTSLLSLCLTGGKAGILDPNFKAQALAVWAGSRWLYGSPGGRQHSLDMRQKHLPKRVTSSLVSKDRVPSSLV